MCLLGLALLGLAKLPYRIAKAAGQRFLEAKRTQSGHPEERPPWGFPASRGPGRRICRTFLRERSNEVSGSFDTPRAMAG
jgi:hypothetical protein